MGLGGRRIMNIYGDLDRAGVSLFCPSDNDFIAVADDFNVARAGEENHGAGMLVDRCFMGNFLDIEIENRIPREVDGFGVHEIAFEKKFDPTPILRDAENQAGGISDTFD